MTSHMSCNFVAWHADAAFGSTVNSGGAFRKECQIFSQVLVFGPTLV